MQKLSSGLARSSKLCRRQVRHQWLGDNRMSAKSRGFSNTARLKVVKPFLLADIGEGIKEVQIIQWFVQPGARVEQFDKLCEVASDKAIVEITSRFDGVIKELHYQPEAMAQVGKPLCDIDIQGDIAPEDEALVTPAEEQAAGHPSKSSSKDLQETRMKDSTAAAEQIAETTTTPDTPSKLSHLATPAVRGLLKELRVNIEQVTGTGRDGRVMKEDVRKFAADPDGKPTATGPSKSPRTINHGPQQETSTSLTPIQHAMFKSMTKSLSIPHFLYGDEVDLTSLTTLRTQLNNHPTTINKLSSLSFIIKAVSIALQDFPLINARVEVSENGESPKLVIRSQHNIGVAMDTPQGLLVPNIKNVATLTIPEIAEQLIELHTRAKASKLTSTDLSGGTITVSNIGSIGGTYVAPIIVQSELAILGVGKSRLVPAFDDVGMVVKKTVGNFSWSADHRVIDGATMARMGERVRTLIEEPALMITNLR